MQIKKEVIHEMIERLLHDIEEEDVGISLFTTFYQDQADLHFFKKEDREQVLKILKKLSEDSKKHKVKKEKPPYLDRIDELEKLDIVRLKGRLDQNTVPLVEARIKENREMGSTISKNVVLDFAKVEHVDSALIASHVLHLKEYQEKGFSIALINVTEELKLLVDVFREKEYFKIFGSEAEAVKALNR